MPTETATSTPTATPTATETPTDEPDGGPGPAPEPTETPGEDVSTLTRTISLDSAVERATVEVRVLAAIGEDDSGDVQVVVQHDGGTAPVLTGGTAGDFETIEVVLENPGDTLTVEVVASGDAGVALDRVRVSPDRDGDGLADSRERVDRLPT